ncbi:DUF4347 domain-containing protein, partial [Heliobacterium mobile]
MRLYVKGLSRVRKDCNVSLKLIFSLLSILLLFNAWIVTLNAEAVTESREIAFIDGGINPTLAFVQSIPQGVEAVVLDNQRDGIEQIAEVLKTRQDIKAIHIFSHGAPGKISLGKGVLSTETMEKYRESLRAISDSLGENSDILIYGCNVAEGTRGSKFIGQLAITTGANVAASTDATGDEALQGNWTLEASTGPIRSKTIAAKYDGLLQTDVLGGVPSKGNLRVTVIDGNVQVERHDGIDFAGQYNDFGTIAGSGAAIDINGSISSLGYYYSNDSDAGMGSLPKIDASTQSKLDNTITTTWNVGSIQIVQKVTLVKNTSQYVKLKWIIYNGGGSAVSNIHFMRGVDSFLSGDDRGEAFWDPITKMIGVKKVTPEGQQRMGMLGISPTPSSYRSGYYYDVTQDVCNGGTLSKTIQPGADVDNGYAMEWTKSTLNAGETWTISANDSFVNAAVIASGDLKASSGEPVTLQFDVQNLSPSAQDASYTVEAPAGWMAVLERSADTGADCIASAGMKTLNVTVTPAVGAQVGDYEIILNITNNSFDTQSVGIVNISGAAPDTTPPTWAVGYPQTGTCTQNGANVLVQTNETGKAYYVVVPDGATAPTAAEVKAGQAAGGASPGAGMSGFVNLTSTSSPATISITGLATATNYDVWLVAEDSVGNLNTSAVKVNIQTTSTTGIDRTNLIGNFYSSVPGEGITGGVTLSDDQQWH